jgi:hypothetical protein
LIVVDLYGKTCRDFADSTPIMKLNGDFAPLFLTWVILPSLFLFEAAACLGLSLHGME